MAFVKIRRDIFDFDIFTDEHLLAFYLHLLFKCKVKKCREGGYLVGRGELFTSVRKLASDLDLNYSITLKHLKTLEKNQLISITTYSKGSLIRVIDFDCTGDFPRNENQSEKLFLQNEKITFEGSTLLYNNKKNVKKSVDARELKSELDDPISAPSEFEDGSAKKSEEIKIPTRDSLVEQYGEANVRYYENRFKAWKNRQKRPVLITCYEAIERWMRDDRVEKPRNASSEAAFNIDEIVQKALSNYNN